MPKRRLTDAEKAGRRAERKAAKMNAKAVAAAGMFAAVPGEVKLTTAAEQLERTRRQHVEAVDGTHFGTVRTGDGKTWFRPLELLEALAIERWGIELIGQEYGPKLAAYIRKTYPWPDYAASAWSEVLSGRKKLVLRWDRVPDTTASIGYRVVPVESFPPAGWTPPLTREQFWARFPYVEWEPGPEPDDGGLFDRVMAAVRANAKGDRNAKA